MNDSRKKILFQQAARNSADRSAWSGKRTAMLVAMCWALSALAGCGGGADEKPANSASASSEHESAAIRLSQEETLQAGLTTETLAVQSFADSVSVTATIHPNEDRFARVAPRIEGRIVRALVNLGDSVRAGQPLAVLDSVTLGEAQSAYQRSQADFRVAQADFKRAEALHADEIIAQRDYLRARGDFEKASAERRSAADKLRLLGGTAAADQTDSRFQLHAPLAGTVVQKKATPGDLSSPNEPVFTIADLSTLWIAANLTEDVLARVHRGAIATVAVAAYPGERFAGRVVYVGSLLDKDSRTIPARIEIDNADGRLKPEMFATASIETNGAKREVLSVPDTAIVLLQGQPTVFIAEADGYTARAIEPGEKISGRTLVKSGIAAGEKVVATGAYALKARMLKSQIGDAH